MAPSATSATSAHFQLLKKTTEVKLHELSKHERRLEAHYAALLATIDDGAQLSADALRRQLDALYDGVRDLQVVQAPVHPGMSGVDELVEFAGADPWSTKRVLQQHTQRILNEIGQKRALWRHNKLLGTLLREALDETERAQKTASSRASEQHAHAPESGFAAAAGDDAGPLMGLTLEETQTRLESFFFTPSGVTEADVLAFLERSHTRTWFSKEKTKRVQDALSGARAALRSFSESFRTRTVSAADVLACVAAMLRDKASFSDDIAAFLADVRSNADMQAELAHVLTIQLSNLHEFQWPADGVAVELKRGMNGRFRCFLQEDALTALLFQYVGLAWAVAVKAELSKLLDAVSDERKFDAGSVEAHRVAVSARFRLAALPATVESAGGAYGDECDDADKRVAKQDIVRLVLAEAHLGRALRGPTSAASSGSALTAVTTDLEFFGPSVSHEAALACLRFLGVDDATLAIFRAYVAVPLVFPGATHPTSMRRGLSVGRMMTMFLAELLLFVLDYQVLAETALPLYRMHDDIWLFDADERKVARAWREMWRVAEVLGLQFNADKSGSLRVDFESTGVAAAPAVPSTSTTELSGDALPSRPITWGLLVLQANGTVEIAAEQVAAFAAEMADRLDAAGSVLAWVNVYNKYMGFFQRNLGNASPVFGLAFVDATLATLRDIHARVFPQAQGDALACLSAKLAANHPALAAERGGASWLLPAAWAHWPMELGGLGLVNPFLAAWALKEPMLAHLQAHHTATDTVWPTPKARWEWRPPFATSVRLDVTEPFELFSEGVAAHGVQWAEQHARARQFLFLTSSSASDAQRWDAPRRATATAASSPLDASYSLRSLDEFVALAGEVAAKDPPLRSAVAQEAATLLQAAGISGAYWKWVAFIYGEQLQTEFGAILRVNQSDAPTPTAPVSSPSAPEMTAM
ncbi:hypothetical protein PybrP1_008689 [[Pythium] brassicae (nom. inval.)]|nr:hypothetical protein PybrP1_008689 [[Pythium] brassicae (nom. inval.)]